MAVSGENWQGKLFPAKVQIPVGVRIFSTKLTKRRDDRHVMAKFSKSGILHNVPERST